MRFADNAANKQGYRVFAGEVSTFETQRDFDAWTVQSGLQRASNRAYKGSWSAYAYEGNAIDESVPRASRVYHDGGEQIAAFEYYWQEANPSYGGGIRLKNSNGDYELGLATDNPAWIVDSSSGKTYVVGSGDFSQDYNKWVRFLVTFDWDAGTFTFTGEDLNDGYTESKTFDLKQGVDVETVELWNYSGAPGWGGGQLIMWWDHIATYTQNGGDLDPQYGIRFTDNAQAASAGDNFSPEGKATSLTLIIRFNSDQLDVDDWSSIFLKNQFGNAPLSIINGSGTINPTFGDSNGNYYRDSATFDHSQDQFYAFTYDRPNGTIANWFDAKKAGENPNVGQITIADNNDDLQLSQGGSGGWWKGTVDQILVYERYVGGDEQAEIRDGTIPTDSLVHRWDFNEGPGSTTVVDKAGSADFTLNGSSWVPPLSTIRHTLSGLRNGEAYVTRASAFTQDDEAFDQSGPAEYDLTIDSLTQVRPSP
ncbi:hypothetical protein [Halorubrum sp. AS12]|uniref:hypothetical protein n=1 Tax=Halorubrum sp. AS12 TaxID=3409687 RepID=UPI003DA7729A